jgi:hypothetical protein
LNGVRKPFYVLGPDSRFLRLPCIEKRILGHFTDHLMRISFAIKDKKDAETAVVAGLKDYTTTLVMEK